MPTYQNLIPKTLPDGQQTDNYSPLWQRYCEALTISRWDLDQRKNFLDKIKDKQRVTDLKYWLTIIWKEKNGN